ncbi:hypothetical protein MACH26_25490 [Planctobacterium marinum]|uniref:TonB-dependent receptor-like beta-barrel domain-containing protein n=1 Tax=Planctobacterium marinum TaxID=1631968 RepID=A0AA48HHI8_9ALTE|nr:hypothetical protein MACH26_25490 [Planctobacterium marinum]
MAPEVEDAHDEHDHQDDHDSHDYVVSNSAEESKGFTLGTSVAFDGGYFGVAVERFEREYGIPGHSHGGDEEINVTADLEQTRIQLKGEHNLNNDYVNTVRLSGGFTEYEHAEIELGVAGTIFENDSSELKVDVLHKPFADWNGAVSFHFKRSKVAAEGEEAFTPPSEEETLALSIMEEKHFGDVLLQVGARVERVKLQAENVLLPELETHAHHDEEEEDHGHDHEHDHDHGDDISVTRVFSADHDFTPVSLSAGLVWDFTPGYNLGLSVSRSERAPSASELLSFGPHIGTRSYEVGALFALHEHEDEMHIELTEEVIDLETANNIDLTLRKTQGDFGFIFNLFYNKVGNYYYQVNTGLFAESGHDHDHGDEHDEHTDELPVYLFRTDDVVLHGFELQAAWQINDSFKTTFFSDYVRARLQDGGDLPRTSPMRFGTTLSYEQNNISAQLDITRYQEQNRIAAEETETDGYTLVDFNVSYDLPILEQDIQLYLKGKNLTDTEARVHTSFLKDIAPRPGRSIAVGIQGFF